MSIPESVQAGGSWAGVALVHVSLVALLGLVAWLAARRGGPALRGAVLVAALVGLLVVPLLAGVAPVWLPLPECVCPAGPAPADSADGVPAPPSPSASEPGVFAILVREAPATTPPNPEDPSGLAGETTPPARAEAVIFNLSGSPEDILPPARPGEAPSPSWSPTGVLAILWLFGAMVFLSRALVRLALLYRCARRARPVGAEAWTDGTESPSVALRESPAVTSPLTLGLFRPMILLPSGWRGWSMAERALILRHELAHVRRHDFVAGLAA